MAKLVRIGRGSGLWDDTSIAAPQLVRRATIDYLVLDYLAEITMSIMARAPGAGFATDFVTIAMPEILREVAERRIRIVSNAGGVNSLAFRLESLRTGPPRQEFRPDAARFLRPRADRACRALRHGPIDPRVQCRDSPPI